MKGFVLVLIFALSTLTACIVSPGPPGYGGVVVSPLPSVIVLGSDPYYYQNGYYYYYNNNAWSYSKSRSGPWTDLPRSHWPKEVRHRTSDNDRHRGSNEDRGRGKDDNRDWDQRQDYERRY